MEEIDVEWSKYKEIKVQIVYKSSMFGLCKSVEMIYFDGLEAPRCTGWEITFDFLRETAVVCRDNTRYYAKRIMDNPCGISQIGNDVDVSVLSLYKIDSSIIGLRYDTSVLSREDAMDIGHLIISMW